MSEYVTGISLAKEGSLIKEYGSENLINVTLIPDIDKAKFSIVKLNSQGKNYVDFYLDMEEMRQLCDEIINGLAARKIEADKANAYPSAYKYVTGVGGSKQLNIGGGKYGARIQINAKKNENWDRKIIALSMDALKTMAFNFRLYSGLTNTMVGSYYHNIFKAFVDGCAERARFSHNGYDAKEDNKVIAPIEAEEECADITKNLTLTSNFTSSGEGKNIVLTANVSEDDKPCMLKIVPETLCSIANQYKKTIDEVVAMFINNYGLDKARNSIRVICSKDSVNNYIVMKGVA